MDSIQLGKSLVSRTSRPYVIAEIGVNHEGSLERAMDLVSAASEGGAQAAKFQTYKADLLAMRQSPAYWDTTQEVTTSQHELFAKYDSFDLTEYETLASHCESLGIDFLSTPFDLGAVDMLDPLVPFFKIASADITNVPLLRRVARSGKPVVLSTGASNVLEIEGALACLHASGASEVILMHCVLNYPTQDRNAHIRMLVGLQAAFPNNLVGYSDHTLPSAGMLSLTTAYALGACVLEKHFTLDKTLSGNDHYHAMDVADLRDAISALEATRTLLGEESDKAALEAEDLARKFARRCIVAAHGLRAGQVLTESDLVAKRPATGIPVAMWDEVLGRRLVHDIGEDEALEWDDIASASD
jgi:sialic acid synthase SpsE